MIIIIVVAVIVVLLGLFFGARYGWRLFGFKYCDSAWIEDVAVSESDVTVEGTFPFSIAIGHSYVGYVSEEKDGILYVGVKFNECLGRWITDTARFREIIPVDGEIKSVVLRYGDSEKIIWDSVNGLHE